MNRPTTLADYLAILRRHVWLIILPAVIAGSVAFVTAKSKAVSYRAEATVLVNRSAGVVSGITAGQDPATGDSIRFLNTQAGIARSRQLAARVVAAAGVPGVTPGGLLDSSSVTAATDADLLYVSVSAPHAKDAVTLANAYASEFSQYRAQLDTAQIDDALRTLRTRTDALAKQGQINSSDYQALSQYQAQLETIRGLEPSNTRVLQPAQNAAATAGRPLRDLVLGALIGAFVGIALAFLVDSLDRRVRTEQEVEALLSLPLLGRVPAPPRRQRGRRGLVLLSEPASAYAEAFRRLRTRLDFVSRERGAGTIMFTSAAQDEGQSTTVANLAVALALGGRRVALVDLAGPGAARPDVGRPSLHSLFQMDPDRGIVDVDVDVERLKSAMQQIALTDSGSIPADSSNGRSPGGSFADGPSGGEGALYLLPCGAIPPLDSGFLESERFSAVLELLGEMFDLVLIDAPPLLASDALSLSTNVDAIVVVAKLGLQRPLLEELAGELLNAPAAPMGLILTGVEHGDGSGYRYDGYRDSVPAKTERGRQAV